MLALLKELKAVFEEEVEIVKEQIEEADNKAILAETDEEELKHFEEAERARMLLDNRMQLISKIEIALTPSMMTTVFEKFKEDKN